MNFCIKIFPNYSRISIIYSTLEKRAGNFLNVQVLQNRTKKPWLCLREQREDYLKGSMVQVKSFFIPVQNRNDGGKNHESAFSPRITSLSS